MATPTVHHGAMFDTDELVINMGPQHPSTHGVLQGGAAARRREGRRCRRGHRLSAPRHREAQREPQLDPDHPADRPDGLRRRRHQQRRLLRDRREADVDRSAAARPLHAHDALRAAADCQPLSVARHPRHGHRRDDGVSLRLPRARADSRSVRGVLRRAPDLQLDADRRSAARSAAGLGQEGARVLQDHGLEDRRVRRAADAQPDLARTDQGHRRDRRAGSDRPRPERRRPARLGRAARRPQGRALRRLRRDGVRRPDRHGRRHLRPLPGAHRRVPPVAAHHPPGHRGPARRADRRQGAAPDQAAGRRDLSRDRVAEG